MTRVFRRCGAMMLLLVAITMATSDALCALPCLAGQTPVQGAADEKPACHTAPSSPGAALRASGSDDCAGSHLVQAVAIVSARDAGLAAPATGQIPGSPHRLMLRMQPTPKADPGDHLAPPGAPLSLRI